MHKISCNKTSWVRFKTTWCYCRKQGWKCPGVSLKPPCFVVRLPLKNIWFRHRKHRWKYPEFLLRTSCFVATNAAEDGSTSCEKYLISAVNVRSFPKKKYAYKRPPKKRPVLQHRHLWIQNVWFEYFPCCETTKRCRKLPVRRCDKKKMVLTTQNLPRRR